MCAVLVLVTGVVGRIAYEQTTEPAYAQDEDPTIGLDCDDYNSQAEAQAALRQDPSDPDVLDEDEGPDDGIACETTDYDDPARDETPVAAAIENGGSASPDPDPEPRQQRRQQRNGLMDSGASGPGPVLTLPDGSCIPDYPVKRNGYCYR